MIETIIVIIVGFFVGRAIYQIGKIIASCLDGFGVELPKRKKRETRKERKAREEREREEAREREIQEDEEHRKNLFYESVWNANWRQNGKPMDIRNIPQLSFEQWLTFYNSSPTNWHFGWEEWNNRYCIFPNYKKGKIDIDIFWETPDDLDKFIQWQRNDYKAGDAAIFEEARNKQLAKLTKALREDMKQRHEQAQKEIEELERQVAASMPTVKEEDPIQKCLREQREEKAKELSNTTSPSIGDITFIGNNIQIYNGKEWKQITGTKSELIDKITNLETKELNSSTDLIAYVCNKHPDYQYAESQRMLTGDGTVITEVTLVHKHKPGNLIRETYFYDEKTKTWQESGMG